MMVLGACAERKLSASVWRRTSRLQGPRRLGNTRRQRRQKDATIRSVVRHEARGASADPAPVYRAVLEGI